MQRHVFLLLALGLPLSFGCEEEEEPPVSDAGPDATPDAMVARCTALTCAVDDEVEAAARGDYRSWLFAPGVTVGAIDLSANGRRIVVGDQAGELHLFTRESGGTPLWTFRAEDSQAQFNSVAMSRDGRAFVATDQLASVHLFTCDQATPTWTFDLVAETGDETDRIVAVAISHDGCSIAAASRERVFLFDRDSATPVTTFTPDVTRGDWLSSLAMSGDGQRVAAGTWISAADGAEVFLYDSQRELGSFQTDYVEQSSNAVVMPIVLSYDGGRMAIGGSDRTIHFFTADLTPAGSHELEGIESSVWDLAMSDDGSRLLAAAGEDSARLFDESRSVLWSYDGSYASPHATGVGLYDPYRRENSPDGDYGIGAYPDTLALSADGAYSAVGAWNSGNLFGFYNEIERPFRVYRSTSASDPFQVVRISADGSWIVAGTTFGEVVAYEVAPAVMMEVTNHVTVSIPLIPLIDAFLDLDDVEFDRTLIKPGRAATLTERWQLWPIIGGVPVPPEASWLVSGGDYEQEHQRVLPDGNFSETTSESMDVPQMFESGLTSATGFVLRIPLEDESSSVQTSDEADLFVDIQVGGM